MEANTLLGISYYDWFSFLRILLVVGGIIAFIAIYVLILRWFDRRAKKKGPKKQPAWKRYYPSGHNSVDLWDPPLPDCEIADTSDFDD
ncbi:MAG TPA: hypothetical protein VKN82_06965 [Desulfohalobiaceae bacterium]|nr:hypothetical protein [Desulfohalobiaceae bacterium]